MRTLRTISIFIAVLLLENVSALTRWSCIQLVPDADLLGSGAVVFSAQGYYYSDVDKGTAVIPSGFVNIGIIEWVNIEAGYTGGPSLGLKAKLLGESRPWMPSLALGARNIFTHREAYLFNRTVDSLGSEFYLVLGKSIESLRLRFHGGIQSIPQSENEKASPFVAIEKYFGMGAYVSIEAFYRENGMHPSVFASWRFLSKKCEVTAGIIDVTGMFLDKKDVSPNSPFYESGSAKFVRPGIWVGLRFNGGLKIGKSGGFTGIENSLNDHSTSITSLRSEVDSLKALLRRSSASIESLNKTVIQITDSSTNDEARYKTIASGKLALLNTLYGAEPFEPDAVNNAMAELVSLRDHILPALYGVIIDPVQEIRIRSLAVSVLGEIGTSAAADIVIGLLGQSTIPEITIECLIALGKMKETRAVYLMQQLSNDPNDDVAFTAAEMLQKIEKETGVSTSFLPVVKPAPVSVPEKTIRVAPPPAPVQKTQPVVATVPAKPSEQESEQQAAPLKGIDEPAFQEATVAPEPEEPQKPALTNSDAQTVPEATLTPQQNTPPEQKQAVVPPPVPSTKETAAPADTSVKNKAAVSTKKSAEKKGEKKAKKKKIDTSSDTW